MSSPTAQPLPAGGAPAQPGLRLVPPHPRHTTTGHQAAVLDEVRTALVQLGQQAGALGRRLERFTLTGRALAAEAQLASGIEVQAAEALGRLAVLNSPAYAALARGWVWVAHSAAVEVRAGRRQGAFIYHRARLCRYGSNRATCRIPVPEAWIARGGMRACPSCAGGAPRRGHGRGNRLTEAEVAEVRTHLLAGQAGAAIARELTISPASISRIRSGKAWGERQPAPTQSQSATTVRR